MRDDQLERLKQTQEQAIDHAIEAMDMAHAECDITTKDGRGDRVWLTKGANESMKLALSIERLLQAKAQGRTVDEPEEATKAAEDMLKRANKRYEEYTQRKQ